MRRVAALAALVLTAACGDNEPACGHVEVLIGGRNVWSPMFAVDDRFIYYADYDLDGFGTKLMLRGSREGGGLQSLGQIPNYEMFGNGLAYDETTLYWTASRLQDGLGYALYQSPRAGGSEFLISNLPPCLPFGVATSPTEVFVGMAACDTFPARVTAVDKVAHTDRVAWEAGMNDGDVRALAFANDTLFIGTSIALLAVRPTETTVITAGSPVRHLEIHDGFLYYSEASNGIYRTPLAGGIRERLYEYEETDERQGPFSLEGEDLYVAEPPQMLLVPLSSREPSVVVKNLGSVSEIAARDGHAYWSALVLPGATGGLDTFSGGIERVSRPCD
jgi:hypothetical protein